MSDNSNIFNEVRNITNKVLDGDTEALDEYETKYPFDTKSSIIRAYLAMKQGQYHHASDKIMQFLNENHYNFETHYIFQKAKQFESKKRYSLALDMYEMLLALIENFQLKQSIVQKIEELYRLLPEESLTETLPDDLDTQLKKIQKTNISLHIMPNHFHCKGYIEFIQNNYALEDHIFLIIAQMNDKDYILEDEFPNTFFFRFFSWEAHMDCNVREYILPLIQQASRIVVHQLKDYVCWLVCRYNIKKNLYWFIWGADLYYYLNENNRYMCDEQTYNLVQQLTPALNKNPLDTINFTYRKGFIRRMRGAITPIYADYELLKQNFVTNAEYVDYFYPGLVDVKEVDKVIMSNQKSYKHKFDYLFMVNHSGFPVNNHLEIFYQLSKFHGNIGIVAPLSYGSNPYIQEILKLGYELFGDRFIPLTEYMNPYQYIELLNEIDVAFFNSNRQIGVGNIRFLIYLGKKVYIKSTTTTFSFFSQHGIKLFDIADLNHSTLEDIVKVDYNIHENKEKLVNLFSIARLKSLHNQFFRC